MRSLATGEVCSDCKYFTRQPLLPCTARPVHTEIDGQGNGTHYTNPDSAYSCSDYEQRDKEWDESVAAAAQSIAPKLGVHFIEAKRLLCKSLERGGTPGYVAVEVIAGRLVLAPDRTQLILAEHVDPHAAWERRQQSTEPSGVRQMLPSISPNISSITFDPGHPRGDEVVLTLGDETISGNGEDMAAAGAIAVAFSVSLRKALSIVTINRQAHGWPARYIHDEVTAGRLVLGCDRTTLERAEPIRYDHIQRSRNYNHFAVSAWPQPSPWNRDEPPTGWSARCIPSPYQPRLYERRTPEESAFLKELVQRLLNFLGIE